MNFVGEHEHVSCALVEVVVKRSAERAAAR